MDYVIAHLLPIGMEERRRRVPDKRYIERAESDYRMAIEMQASDKRLRKLTKVTRAGETVQSAVRQY